MRSFMVVSGKAAPRSHESYYFELDIVALSSEWHVGIGAASCTYVLSNAPGWERGSVGYHLEDGQLFNAVSDGVPFGPICAAGDTIGCGWGSEDKKTSVFFTRNGTIVGTVPDVKVPKSGGPAPRGFFPIISMDHKGTTIRLRLAESFGPVAARLFRSAASGSARDISAFFSSTDTAAQESALQYRNETGHSALHAAVLSKNRKSVCMLLEHGALVDAVNKAGRTPLACAAVMGFLPIVKTLMDSGADLGIADAAGSSIFDAATLPVREFFMRDKRLARTVSITVKKGETVIGERLKVAEGSQLRTIEDVQRVVKDAASDLIGDSKLGEMTVWSPVMKTNVGLRCVLQLPQNPKLCISLAS